MVSVICNKGLQLSSKFEGKALVIILQVIKVKRKKRKKPGALGDGRTETPPCRTEAGSLSGGRGLESSEEGVG